MLKCIFFFHRDTGNIYNDGSSDSNKRIKDWKILLLKIKKCTISLKLSLKTWNIRKSNFSHSENTGFLHCQKNREERGHWLKSWLSTNLKKKTTQTINENENKLAKSTLISLIISTAFSYSVEWSCLKTLTLFWENGYF